MAQVVITCSSDDMRRNYCAADTRGGVRMIRQRSDAACREGHSWGVSPRGIWVDRGCRADFEIGAGGERRGYRGRGDRDDDDYRRGYGGGESVISCSSDDMRRHFCGADVRGARVNVLRQHSDAACREGYSWGTTRQGIWVDRGCRAEFIVRR